MSLKLPRNRRKTIIFIDGPNFNRMFDELGIRREEKHLRFIAFLQTRDEVIDIRYYYPIPRDIGKRNNGFARYQDLLRHKGFKVIHPDECEDVDNKLCQDLKYYVKNPSDIEKIIVISGDGIYCEFLENAVRNGLRVEVWAIKNHINSDYNCRLPKPCVKLITLELLNDIPDEMRLIPMT